MYNSNSNENHIFDGGLDVFLYFFITVIFSVGVFLFDVGDLLVKFNVSYTDIALQVSTTNSLSVSGFLFFASIAYDFWSRYNTVLVKEKYIRNILLFLWILFFLVTVVFLLFIFMRFNENLFISKQSDILATIKRINYVAAIPIIISVIEGIRFIIEHHEKLLENSTKKDNQKKRDIYRKSSV